VGTPAEFRKHARECVELAEKAMTEHHRALLLGMAEKWLKLADQAQREDELVPLHRGFDRLDLGLQHG
jgi:hypothetical protein